VSEPNPGGYIMSLCDGISRELDKNLPWVEFSYNNNYRRVWKWHRLKHYMDIDVALHSTGLSRG
jgi:hypothetical protein